MTWWEALIYQLGRVLMRALLDELKARETATLEAPNDEDRAATARFRAAIQRLRAPPGSPR